ncbi:putative Phenol 2-monooxygenase [Glarea lozoyensis 74030]|nr:putative Phenol 2-monooxygenase [Glarea lozoyensis 74030]
MTTTEKGGGKPLKVDRSNITPQMILECAQKTIAPYKLTYNYCDWWTAYQIGQRICPSFSANERIFLAGDAVHTHSPKAGQGMNVSMQDTYNLGWKIASVLKGTAHRSILKTYQSERHRIAQDLIDFDHKFSRLFSGRPAKDVMDEAGISMSEFKSAFEKGNLFASGVAVDYGASILVAKEGNPQDGANGTNIGISASSVHGKPEVAKNIKMGMRFPSFQVLNQADARPWQFQERLKSDGRWRLILFAGNISNPPQMTRITNLCANLSPIIKRYTPAAQPIDSRIEILTLHSAPRASTELFSFPELLRPLSDEGWDYWKIFVDDESYHEGHGRAYEGYGADAERGCLVVVRPDGYVGWEGEIEDIEDIGRYFEGFMVVQR